MFAFQMASAQSERSSNDVIVNCAADVDADITGLVDLDAECVGLEPALVHAGFSPFLSEQQSATLTGDSLSDLAQLRNFYARQSPEAASLQVDGIATIVQSLDQARAAAPLTLWERFSRWVRQFFDRRQAPGESWLTQWLRDQSLPQKVTDALTTGLLVLVVIVIIVIVVNELRAAGVLTRRAGGSGARAATVYRMGAALTFADISAAPMREQPSLLLQLIVAALVESKRLSNANGLTHRELANRVRFDTQVERDRFHRLASGAQYARYSRESLTANQVNTLMDDARALYFQITTLPASDPGSLR